MLLAAGVERTFSEKVSGVAARQPEPERALDELEAGDVMVVTKLDRLARSTSVFHCDGFEALRDVNAALNLARLPASSAMTACGEPRSGAGREPRVKRGSAKQEEKTVILEAA